MAGTTRLTRSPFTRRELGQAQDTPGLENCSDDSRDTCHAWRAGCVETRTSGSEIGAEKLDAATRRSASPVLYRPAGPRCLLHAHREEAQPRLRPRSRQALE